MRLWRKLKTGGVRTLPYGQIGKSSKQPVGAGSQTRPSRPQAKNKIRATGATSFALPAQAWGGVGVRCETPNSGSTPKSPHHPKTKWPASRRAIPACQKTQILYFFRRHVRRKKSLLSPKCAPSGRAQGDSRAIFSEFRKIRRKLPARSPCRKKPVRAFSTVSKLPGF